MDRTLSEKESFELIRQMISTAKNNLQKGMGKIFLLWGYLVALISLANFILLVVLTGEAQYNSYYLWALMGLGYPVHWMWIRKIEHARMITTYVEKMMTWVWVAFAISIVTVVLGLVCSSLLVMNRMTMPGQEFLHWFQWLFMPPFLVCLYGLALFISGKAYQFRPMVTGGIICWLGALFLLVSLHHPQVLELQQAVICLCALAGFVVPGHLLSRKEKSHV